MKKFVSCFLALLLALTALSGLAMAESAAHEITSAEFPLYSKTEDTGVAVPLYFLDGVKDLPYVNTDGLVFLLEGLMDFVTTPFPVCLLIGYFFGIIFSR